ncbi:MAG TPA: ABC transporter substrate-binding protein [Candidatus Acidoferrales bacterium]|nr:ABC transporter substrate-binding protein [Candidatus Acidoferrales bacterium]
MAALWVAKDRGFFNKYGLDVQFILMPRSAITIASLVAGEIDMAIVGPGNLLNAAAGGAELVGVGNLVQRLDYRFVARPEIKKVEDLRGKRIAISGPGAVSHIVALLALQSLGIDPNQLKITFLTIPGTEVNRRIALESNSVEATTLNGAVGDLYANRGYSLLYNFKGSGVILPQTVLTTARRTAATKPQIVDSYLKAFVEAIAYLLDPANKTAMVRLMATNLRLNNPAEAEESYQTVVSSYERIPYPNLEGMKKLHGILISINPKIASVRPESVVDYSFIQKLESSGFIQNIGKKP